MCDNSPMSNTGPGEYKSTTANTRHGKGKECGKFSRLSRFFKIFQNLGLALGTYDIDNSTTSNIGPGKRKEPGRYFHFYFSSNTGPGKGKERGRFSRF